ncbi:MAG: class II fumarate hydratase [Desulfobacterales bacterium]|nr:class II fumarate hydratase [Desulfobacterales bacterium]
MNYREETDSLGTVRVPQEAYYGAQTRRAMDNFPVSSLRLSPVMIRSIARIKKAAALVNRRLGRLDPEHARAVAEAADEVSAGEFDDQFPVDIFQTGSGTSTNMNVNEVIATRANEVLTGQRKTKSPVHPNDHVNAGQSSNDVIPSAIHISALLEIREKLIPAFSHLGRELEQKAEEFAHIRKIGRTHLQDAVVMTLGQEFSGYAEQAYLSVGRLEGLQDHLCRLALGGTAVGTGLNTHPEFAGRVIDVIAADTGIPFIEAPNHFEAQGACDGAVEAGGVLKTAAVSLSKIANDIRWLASGPRCGLGEIRLPALQPGSSIMPGKVNPVICESAIQACAHVIGNDTSLTLAGQGGYFELNLMLPLVAYKLLDSIGVLSGAAEILARKCVSGIAANEARCTENIEKSLAVVTGLVPHIGYERAARIAHLAHETGKTVETVALEENVLPAAELRRALYGETKV